MNNTLKNLPAIHPGEFVKELINDLNITAYRLAKDTNLPPIRVSEIIKGKRGVSVDTAGRFGIYFNTSVEYWLNMQQSYEIKKHYSIIKDIDYHISPIQKLLAN